MSYTSPLVLGIINKTILGLQLNQNENGGIVDYERLFEELQVYLKDIQILEYERSECLTALEDVIFERDLIQAFLREAKEHINSLECTCKDLQLRDKSVHTLHSFCSDQLN